MSAIAWQEAVDAYAEMAQALRRCAAVQTDALSTQQRLWILEEVETARRMLPALEHASINGLAEQASRAELGGRLSHALADRLRIMRIEASGRVGEAADLAPRRTFTGQPLAPRLAATAAAQRQGQLSGEHVRVIHGFLHRLPGWVDAPTRERAEADLARWSTEFRPEEVLRLAQHMIALLDPDGRGSDSDRARRRGLTIGLQDIDGMSPIRGWLNPELRAGLDAVLAKWAAPGMCNPDDQTAVVEGEPTAERAEADTRSTAQRNHDALNAMVRSVLSSGELGSHRGLPVTIVANVELKDLQAKAGVAKTGGGALLPVRDLIRMARHAYHYLAIFDDAKKCDLYRGASTRLATKEQRLVLHALDRGCTHPGCDVPGYLSEVHHVEGWATNRRTDIDDLTFACGVHHDLVTNHGWSTRKLANGDTEWIPPRDLDTGRPRTNSFHHPEKLRGRGEADDDDDSREAG